MSRAEGAMRDVGELEHLIEAHMRAVQIPGLAIAIVRGQEVAYTAGFGVTSVEDGGLPITPQTLFRTASTGKPLTGTAVLRLVEQGKLELDRPVRHYIPWFTTRDPGAADAITPRMLLSHTSGLPYDFDLAGPRDPEGLEEFVRTQVARYLLVAPPGQCYEYSNAGSSVAGYLAEVVTGKYYVDLMQGLVFDPLEMRRTTFDPTVAMTYPLAQGHQWQPGGVPQVWHQFFCMAAYNPAGMAFSTVLDLANFAIMQLNQGRFCGQQILAPESVAAMQTIQAPFPGSDDAGYGLQFFIQRYKGVRLVGHTGGIPYFHTQFVMAPDQSVAVVIMLNRLTGVQTLVDYALDMLLDATR